MRVLSSLSCEILNEGAARRLAIEIQPFYYSFAAEPLEPQRANACSAPLPTIGFVFGPMMDSFPRAYWRYEFATCPSGL